MTTKDIPLGDVLSVTTGKLVSRDHIGGVYNVCDFMPGVSNFTHQLPRVADTIKPVIFDQHPWLEDVEVPAWEFDEDDDRNAIVIEWLTQAEALYGETVSLTSMESYSAPNPLVELTEMVG